MKDNCDATIVNAYKWSLYLAFVLHTETAQKHKLNKDQCIEILQCENVTKIENGELAILPERETWCFITKKM